MVSFLGFLFYTHCVERVIKERNVFDFLAFYLDMSSDPCYILCIRKSFISHMSLEKLHRMIQHTKQDAKVGLAYMKWNEVQDMWRQEGKREGKQEGTILFAIKIVKKMLKQNHSMEEISQFTELPIHLAKKIVGQINVHPEWDGEQILKGIQEQEK